jgi:hypothetical protein
MLNQLSTTLLLSALSLALVACMEAPETEAPGSTLTSGGGDVVSTDDTEVDPLNDAPPGATARVTFKGCDERAIGLINAEAKLEAFTMSFGGTIATEDSSVDCTATVHYEFPAGWQLVAPRAHARGHVAVDEGSVASASFSARLDGRVIARASRAEVVESEDFVLSAGEPDLGITPCGATRATFAFRTTAFVEGSAAVHLDSFDGETDWVKCD